MDSNALQAIVFLAMCLPISMGCWAVGFVSAGWPYCAPEDSSAFFSFAAGAFDGMLTNGRSVTGLVVAVVGIALFNFYPFAILVRNPYGTQSLIVAVVYLFIHGVWLATITRKILRARHQAPPK